MTQHLFLHRLDPSSLSTTAFPKVPPLPSRWERGSGGEGLISRRTLLGLPVGLLLQHVASPTSWAHADRTERETIAAASRDVGLVAPLTLGVARVILRPGAATWAAIPDGVRLIVVESGVLGIAADMGTSAPVTAAEFAVSAAPPEPNNEFILPAGAALTFGARGVTSVRNPGGRSAVLLDVALFHEEPRPLARAFTTESGVSFQLLASANVDEVPAGPVSVTLELIRLGSGLALPEDLSAGLTLMYLEVGAADLLARGGEVFAARAAASAPYAMPGALQPVAVGERRALTAGGVVFLPLGAGVAMSNPGGRAMEALALTVREEM